MDLAGFCWEDARWFARTLFWLANNWNVL